MYGSDDGGWMFGGGFMMLLWWLVPIALVIVLVGFFVRHVRTGTNERTALDILKEQYSHGEIGKDEFEQKKRDLGI